MIFPKSVVTRLLIRPMRLLALDVPAGGLPLSLPVLCPVEEVESTLNELDLAVSSEEESMPALTAVTSRVCSEPSSCEGATTVPVLSLALSVIEVVGSCEYARGFTSLSFSVSALTRIRRACSKTS